MSINPTFSRVHFILNSLALTAKLFKVITLIVLMDSRRSTLTANQLIRLIIIFLSLQGDKSRGWSEWGNWGPCDTNCTKERERFCSAEDIGKCPGANGDRVQLQKGKCPYDECYGEWKRRIDLVVLGVFTLGCSHCNNPGITVLKTGKNLAKRQGRCTTVI